MMSQIVELSRRLHTESVAVTFDVHPRQVVGDAWQPRLLCSASERRELLLATGIDCVETLHFDRAMAALSAHDFMRDVLRGRLGVSCLVLGYDNRFGRRTAGEDFDDYVRYGHDLGIEIIRARERDICGVAVSSTVVRSFLEAGEIEQAALCLGRPYSIAGTVVHGRQVGRTIGFPTANIDPDDKLRLIPAGGVYEVGVSLHGGQYKGMANIGTRPTFHDGGGRTIEVHILDFEADIYGRRIAITFLRKIRDEKPFGSVKELKRQLEKDRARIG